MSFIVPFVDDSMWPFTRRDFDVFDLDPWGSRRHHHRRVSPLATLLNLANEVDNMQNVVGQQHASCGISKDNYRLAVDVHGYNPSELAVSVDGRTLTLSGKHEEKSEDGKHFVSRQFTRSYVVPESVDIEKINSTLASDGRVLRVEAPLKPEAIEAAKKAEAKQDTPIPVQFKQQAIKNK